VRADHETVARLIGGASWVKAVQLAGVSFDIVGAEVGENHFQEPEIRFTILLSPERPRDRLPDPVVVLGMEPTDIRARIVEHFQHSKQYIGPVTLDKREDGVWQFLLTE